MASINGAADVQALLEQLRSSQAWQETMGTSSVDDLTQAEVASTSPPTTSQIATLSTATENEAADSSEYHEDPAPAQPTTVALLLSQLQSSPAIHALTSSSHVIQNPPSSHVTTHMAVPQSEVVADPRLARRAAPPAVPRQDLRRFTFQQTLPVVAQLSDDDAFVQAVRKLKEEQIQLEKRLLEERGAIEKKHEDRVQVARTKANMIGVALSKFEADSMRDTFRRELQQFDKERVLPAWDGLVSRQQSTLEALGVPTMFPTSATAERQKQQRVVQVLNGVAE